MHYRDLRDFIAQLEGAGELIRVRHPVDPKLEMTEICDRTLRAAGPALLFEQPTGFDIPVLGNLFGTPQSRVDQHDDADGHAQFPFDMRPRISSCRQLMYFSLH